MLPWQAPADMCCTFCSVRIYTLSLNRRLAENCCDLLSPCLIPTSAFTFDLWTPKLPERRLLLQATGAPADPPKPHRVSADDECRPAAAISCEPLRDFQCLGARGLLNVAGRRVLRVG